jgi:hypothetical protein
MFYIVGVSHHVQGKKIGELDTQNHTKYRAIISETIARFHPVLVAEEMNEEQLRTNGEESVTKPTAESCGVKHCFCDPDEKTRKEIGYRDRLSYLFDLWHDKTLSQSQREEQATALLVAKSWPIREKFWLDHLKDVWDKNVIFVCGNAHVETFIERLTMNRILSTVIERGIGVDPQEIEGHNRIVAYLESHPELRS